MFSKRELEGYLLIDHRESPGITPDEAAAAGKGTIPVGRGMRLEVPAVKCSHCERLVILKPGRTRDRGYCPKCDRYVCDECEGKRVASGGLCYSFDRMIDDLRNAAAHGQIINAR